MIDVTYKVMTPHGAFEAQWDEDEEKPVQYAGSPDAIAYFRWYLDFAAVTGQGGARVRFDALQPADLYGFCQSELYGITVLPTVDDLKDEAAEAVMENEETNMQAVLDAVSDADTFTLIGEGAQLLARLDENADTFFADLGRLREIIQLLGSDAQPEPEPQPEPDKPAYTVMRAADFAESGNYDVTTEDGYTYKIFRDPESGNWYQGDTGRHFSEDWLGFKKEEAAAKVVERGYRPPVKTPTLPQPDAAAWKNLREDILSSMAAILGIDHGETPGMDRALFVSSIAGKIRRTNDRGDTALAGTALAFVSVGQRKFPKPVFAPANKLWKDVNWQPYVAQFEPAAPEPAPADVPAATLAGNELGEFSDDAEGYKGLREAAAAYLDGLVGQSVHNAALGADIFIRKSGNKKLTRMGASRLKLKLAPATLAILRSAKKDHSAASTDATERNVVAYHYMRAQVEVGTEIAKVYVVIKEDDKGNFLYEEFVNRGALRGISGVASAADGLPLDGPDLAQGTFDSVVPSGMVFNLFIDGEAPEEVTEEQEPEPVSEMSLEDRIAKAAELGAQALAKGFTAPASDPEFQPLIAGLTVATGMLKVMDAWNKAFAAANAAAPVDGYEPGPSSTEARKPDMETLIKIAADNITQLRRIDVYRVLNAAGEQRAELAAYIVAHRADLTAEVTTVMAEEWPDLQWNGQPPVEPTPTGTEDTTPPTGGGDEQTTADPQRAADLAFLQAVIGKQTDMWADDLADRIEALAEKYPGDEAMAQAWADAINAYTNFMVEAMNQPA